jgi:hypothetical protein
MRVASQVSEGRWSESSESGFCEFKGRKDKKPGKSRQHGDRETIAYKSGICYKGALSRHSRQAKQMGE